MNQRRKLTKDERMAVYEKTNGHCAYCGCELEYKDMQVDHVIPINGWSEQGEDTMDNMLPACRSCNHYKSRSTLEGFRKMVENMLKLFLCVIASPIKTLFALAWSHLLHTQSNSILSNFVISSVIRSFSMSSIKNTQKMSLTN